jgi:spore coat polysaccharide biosynthesis protein SpsF
LAVAIVQARMGSSRLPGKVLRCLAGRPLLLHVLERLRAAARIDTIVVATTDRSRDEPIRSLAAQAGVLAVAGPEDDVLSRYLLAAEVARAEVVVRVTADCPLLDPATVDAAVDAFLAPPPVVDLRAGSPSGFPPGLDVEVFTADALRRADPLSTDPAWREHVTQALRRPPFRTRALPAPPELHHPDWRLCVDEEADLRLVEEIHRRLGRPGVLLDVREVARLLLASPELASMNAHVVQRLLPA